MEKLLSLIIPTYNMEKYLPYCLESLVVTDQLSSIEVLVINDGSCDGSSRIAHLYEERYPDVFRAIDKSNGNYGSCVNKGLKEARGKYVKILDADDSLNKEALEQYLKFLSTVDVDLVVSDFEIVNEQRESVKTIKYDLPPYKLLTYEEAFICESFANMEMHAVTYNMKIFGGLNYHQTEGISYTDQQWVFLPISKVRTIAHFPVVLYRYLVGRQGQTMDVSIMKKSRDQLQRCCIDMAIMYQDNIVGMDRLHATYLYHRLARMAKGIYLESLKNITPHSKPILCKFDMDLAKESREFHASLGSHNNRMTFIGFWRRFKFLPCWCIRLTSKSALLLKNARGNN